MSVSKKSLGEYWDEGVCPVCGKKIPEGTRVGSGRKADGGFCSLDCYTAYHGTTHVQKHLKTQKERRRGEN